MGLSEQPGGDSGSRSRLYRLRFSASLLLRSFPGKGGKALEIWKCCSGKLKIDLLKMYQNSSTGLL